MYMLDPISAHTEYNGNQFAIESSEAVEREFNQRSLLWKTLIERHHCDQLYYRCQRQDLAGLMHLECVGTDIRLDGMLQTRDSIFNLN